MSEFEDLGKYFDSLNDRQKYYLKGVVDQPIEKLVSLIQGEFLKQIRDSLTIEELAQLQEEDLEYRGKLIEEVLAVWEAHKGISFTNKSNAAAVEAEQQRIEEGEGEGEGAEDRSPSEILLDLVGEKNITFFKDQYRIAHAWVTISNHSEIMRVESNAFKRYLTKLYYDSEDKVIGSESVKNVVNMLQARAEFEGQTFPLALRVAW